MGVDGWTGECAWSRIDCEVDCVDFAKRCMCAAVIGIRRGAPKVAEMDATA